MRVGLKPGVWKMGVAPSTVVSVGTHHTIEVARFSETVSEEGGASLSQNRPKIRQLIFLHDFRCTPKP